jgi:hypothetical protein
MSSSSSPPPKKMTTTISLNDGHVTATQKFYAGCVLGGFIVMWLLSVSSPFLFVICVAMKCYVFASFIALATVVAYAPWEQNSMTRRFHKFISEYTPYHFQSVQVIVQGEMPNNSNDKTATPPTPTFFAIHPHGAFCMGWSILFCHELMGHVRFCFAPYLFASPFFRIFCRLTGRPGSASRPSMSHYMAKGDESIALPPGGFEEATLSCTTVDRVFIKKRTGFIKLCLKYGMPVRPIYVFGEKGVFWNVQGLWKLRLSINRYGFPTILPWGHPLFALVPKTTVPLTIVIGEPLVLPKIVDRDPTKEEVTMWHAKYMAALTRIFEEHKEIAYGPEAKTAKLEMW